MSVSAKTFTRSVATALVAGGLVLTATPAHAGGTLTEDRVAHILGISGRSDAIFAAGDRGTFILPSTCKKWGTMRTLNSQRLFVNSTSGKMQTAANVRYQTGVPRAKKTVARFKKFAKCRTGKMSNGAKARIKKIDAPQLGSQRVAFRVWAAGGVEDSVLIRKGGTIILVTHRRQPGKASKVRKLAKAAYKVG